MNNGIEQLTTIHNRVNINVDMGVENYIRLF